MELAATGPMEAGGASTGALGRYFVAGAGAAFGFVTLWRLCPRRWVAGLFATHPPVEQRRIAT